MTDNDTDKPRSIGDRQAILQVRMNRAQMELSRQNAVACLVGMRAMDEMNADEIKRGERLVAELDAIIDESAELELEAGSMAEANSIARAETAIAVQQLTIKCTRCASAMPLLATEYGAAEQEAAGMGWRCYEGLWRCPTCVGGVDPAGGVDVGKPA